MAVFILLNGYPGVGKLTIARQLCKLIPNAKVLSNHLQIDPVASIYDRDAPEYQPLRIAMRQLLLNSIATSTSTRNITWIFTEQQSSNPGGTPVIMDYVDAAKKRGVPLVSIVISCSKEENNSRAISHGRGITGFNSKLTDLAILDEIRDTEDIFHFGDEYELDLDVTNASADEAASAIVEHLEKVLRLPTRPT